MWSDIVKAGNHPIAEYEAVWLSHLLGMVCTFTWKKQTITNSCAVGWYLLFSQEQYIDFALDRQLCLSLLRQTCPSCKSTRMSWITPGTNVGLADFHAVAFGSTAICKHGWGSVLVVLHTLFLAEGKCVLWGVFILPIFKTYIFLRHVINKMLQLIGMWNF